MERLLNVLQHLQLFHLHLRIQLPHLERRYRNSETLPVSVWGGAGGVGGGGGGGVSGVMGWWWWELFHGQDGHLLSESIFVVFIPKHLIHIGRSCQ